jgi:hypothetical protein
LPSWGRSHASAGSTPSLSFLSISIIIFSVRSKQPQGMSNRGSGMLLPHISTNLKSKWNNRCEKYWSNSWHFLPSSKVCLVSLFTSHLFPPFSLLMLKRQPPAEETASLKVQHPSLNWTTRI